MRYVIINPFLLTFKYINMNKAELVNAILKKQDFTKVQAKMPLTHLWM